MCAYPRGASAGVKTSSISSLMYLFPMYLRLRLRRKSSRMTALSSSPLQVICAMAAPAVGPLPPLPFEYPLFRRLCMSCPPPGPRTTLAAGIITAICSGAAITTMLQSDNGDVPRLFVVCSAMDGSLRTGGCAVDAVGGVCVVCGALRWRTSAAVAGRAVVTVVINLPCTSSGGMHAPGIVSRAKSDSATLMPRYLSLSPSSAKAATAHGSFSMYSSPRSSAHSVCCTHDKKR
mmetsp:Transcript_8135/g.25053  ORF Transcript_8135/g.25053 Transcript_8135/m.25053 type:complete len:233 (-) Transcript_8135:1335-2033(-)